jgi:prenyltransferase beta subunit
VSITHSPAQTVAFLHGLRREAGGFADASDGAASLRSTLSVLKALDQLGDLGAEPRTIAFVGCCHDESGGFAGTPGAAPSPLDTSAGLIALRTLRQDEMLQRFLSDGLAYLKSASATAFDHFMLIATYEECQVDEPVPAATIAFFQGLLERARAANTVVDLAIAGSALMRAGSALHDPADMARRLLAGQRMPAGGFGDGDQVSLFGTYCVMRQLVLLKTLPNTRCLVAYLESLRTELGYADSPGGKTAAGSTYQCLSILAWLKQLQREPVRAAGEGNVAWLRSWLGGGGDPNLTDQEGWTPLLSAAAHGQADAVDLLLNHDIADAPHADPAQRLAEADALPLYMAGQAGDLRTVQLLLRAAPEQLHAISSVNGHTVLLQAAFYGKEKHLQLASWLLDQATEIQGLPASALGNEQLCLLSATNVRGYNALGMQDLWHNEQMKVLLLRYYPGGTDGERGREIEVRRVAYVQKLLLSIATPQTLTEKVLAEITTLLETDDATASEQRIATLLAQPQFEIDRLGGDLQMSPLVFAVTGVDSGNPERACRRYALVKTLLAVGADPKVREQHPMGVGAVIRASVLNNFALLQLLAEAMPAQEFTAEMNVRPAVNGLTAMHDAVHRALTAPPAELGGHLAQIAWMIERGASLSIANHTGQTPQQLADAAQGDAGFPQENVHAILTLLAVDNRVGSPRNE